MPKTDTSEKGLETLIVNSLIDGAGYVAGDSRDFDRDHAVDLAKLSDFITETQPKAAEALGLNEDGPKRLQFLHRLQGEIAKRGVIDVLRNGIKHGPVSLELFYPRTLINQLWSKGAQGLCWSITASVRAMNLHNILHSLIHF